MDEKCSIVRNLDENRTPWNGEAATRKYHHHDLYTFHVEGGKIEVFVDNRGGFVSTTEGIKEYCKFCEQSECIGDCDDARSDTTENANDYFFSDRPKEMEWNRIVDGVEALTAQLCAAGKVDERSGGVRTLYIDDLREAIRLALEGAANNG